METIRKGIYHLTAAMFLAILLVLGASVVMRYVFNNSLVWSEEVMRFSFIWMFFLAMSEVSRNGAHLALDLIPSLISGLFKKILLALIELVNIGFLIVLAKESWHSALYNMSQRSSAIHLPYGLVYMAVPVGCVLMGLFTIQRIYWIVVDRLPESDKMEEIE